MRILLLLIELLLVYGSASAHAAQLTTLSVRGEVTVQSWKALRDAHVVKQDSDYSCGAASLATLLNEFYGLSLTEEQILKDMNKPDMMANFGDMARVVNRYGFKSGGVALSYEQLAKLTVPVLVYLQHRGEDHFSVLRGISATQVQLADPSWGNRIFSKGQFLAMWETREDEKLKGKILLVLPQKADVFMPRSEFFAPPTSSSVAIEILTDRRNR
ncbi:MAG: bacteriocin resistance [Gallionellaceae bacterium]|nr:MAG: bacteriocin resistance [Gallionellaceae bacterium]